MENATFSLAAAEKEYGALLESLGWNEEKILCLDFTRNVKSIERDGDDLAWCYGRSQPNIVALPGSGRSLGDEGFFRVKKYQECVDLGALERVDRDIKPLKPSSFEAYLPDADSRSLGKIKQSKLEFENFQNDYKRRKQRYRGSTLMKKTPKQVRSFLDYRDWYVYIIM